jgi:hypothetical protein
MTTLQEQLDSICEPSAALSPTRGRSVMFKDTDENSTRYEQDLVTRLHEMGGRLRPEAANEIEALRTRVEELQTDERFYIRNIVETEQQLAAANAKVERLESMMESILIGTSYKEVRDMWVAYKGGEPHKLRLESVIDDLNEQLAAMTVQRDQYKGAADNLGRQLAASKADFDALAVQHADRFELLESHRQQYADKCLELIAYQQTCQNIADELAAAQADNARLREALEQAKVAVEYGYDAARCHSAFELIHTAQVAIVQALAAQPDHAALDARLAQERERVAQMVLNGAFLHTEAPVAIWAREVAAAIRRMT